MMDLDEAIQHCEEVAETNERICDTEPSIGLPDIYKHKDEAKKCASEHRQLAEWLRELKAYREQRGDAISRQAMHIELEKWITYGEYKYSNATKYLYDRIDRLPSVTPQTRTGRWITSHIPESMLCECSECGFTCGAYSFNYCPNCGAKMEVEE